MQLTNLLLLASHLLGAASGLNIVLSNDDGWAEVNIRVFYNALTKAGNSVVLSAPAVDRSGTGMSFATGYWGSGTNDHVLQALPMLQQHR